MTSRRVVMVALPVTGWPDVGLTGWVVDQMLALRCCRSRRAAVMTVAGSIVL